MEFMYNSVAIGVSLNTVHDIALLYYKTTTYILYCNHILHTVHNNPTVTPQTPQCKLHKKLSSQHAALCSDKSKLLTALNNAQTHFIN